MLVILIGKSGSGKDTIKNCLCKEIDAVPLVSTTTRKKRPSEIEGVDYYFTSNEDFENKIKDGKIVEYREYESDSEKIYYGAELKSLDRNRMYVKVLDVKGARDYINVYGRENCFVTKIYVPDKLRYERAFKRQFNNQYENKEKENFDKEWSVRLNDDNKRFSYECIFDIINFTINNQSTCKNTINELCKAISAYKNRMNEFIEMAHLHTKMIYPQLLVDKIDGKYIAYTIDELNKPMLNHHLEVERLESLEYRTYLEKL